ncbi:MAG: transporter [Robiginitomaculum sp.]|nr:transporter [Robiginitomaculum sp.]MDQ7076954.1 transporter [Robiginitomaculum sp.]
MVKTSIQTVCLLGALMAAPGTAFAAPITFNTALPVSKGEFLARQQFIVTNLSDRLGGMKRDVTVRAGVSVLGYGVTPKLAVFGVAPLVNIDREIGTMNRNDTGLGDATVFARYEIYRKDRPGKTIRIAPFAGLTLPTGRTGKTGDGSTDGFAGLIFTAASTNWNFDSQIKYTVNRRAKGFARGDTISADASLQYRLSPNAITVSTHGFLYGVMEANLTQLQRDRLGGLINPDSGGTQAFLSPGLQYATRRWIAETALKIPVVNDLHGAALAPNYSLITSLRFNF